MFNPCTYQKRISIGICLLFIYYYAFPLFDSYPLGQSRFSTVDTLHINYIPLYLISLWEHSKTTMYYYYSEPTSHSITISFIISLLFMCEILFYSRWKYLENYIHSNVTMFDTKPTLNIHRRDHLLKMAAKYATIYDGGMSGWTSLWFPGTALNDIYYENATEMLEWAFFLNSHESGKTIKDHEGIQRFTQFAINCIESITEHSFHKGYNPNISFVRNTNDDVPLRTTYRPFIFYLCLLIAQYMTDCIFIYIFGFEYRFQNGLKVWYKIQSDAHKESKSKPILLVHGLGLHFMPYIPLVYKLYTKSKENDVICIEIPWIVMSIWHFIPKRIWKLFSNEASPSYIDSRLPCTSKDFVQILQKMEDIILLKSASMQRRRDGNILKLEWTLIGHSYGSFIISGIYDYIKQYGNGLNIPRLVLLDPVALCTSHPNTVRFVMLPTTDWAAYLMQQIAARELMILCTVRKYFHWFEYSLFPEDLINEQVEHVIVTATGDTLLPQAIIAKGIENINEKRIEKGYKKIHHIEFENMHHAVWLLFMSRIQRIVDAV